MIRKTLTSLALGLALVLSASNLFAQASESIEPFKVGTFATDDTPFVGLVVRDDSLIVDLVAANRAMQLQPQYARLDMPNTMLGLIEQYEYGLKGRVYEVMNWLVEDGLLSGNNRPGYIH